MHWHSLFRDANGDASALALGQARDRRTYAISELLLPELDGEMTTTGRALKRLLAGKENSKPCNKLANLASVMSRIFVQ